MKKTKYVAYYRVSTQKQGESKLGLEAQEHLVQSFLDSKKAEELPPSFTEVESGNNGDRPELKKAIQRCKETGATLLIAKLDRLSRNVAFIFNLKAELEKAGVGFTACDLPEANTLTLGIMATMAQHERETISKRISAALQAKKRRGEKVGNPEHFTLEHRQKAWRSIAEQARKDPDTRKAFHFIKPRREAGQTFKAIADELNSEGYRTRRNKKFFPAQVQKIYLRFTEDKQPPDKPDKPITRKMSKHDPVKEIHLELLKNVAKEFNKVMGLDPQIETDNVDTGYLESKIKEASALIDPIEDEFSEPTTKYLESSGLMPKQET